MKKKKRFARMSAPVATDVALAATQEGLSGTSFISAGSLLNKYNQKRPSGTKKLSPAADEEME